MSNQANSSFSTKGLEYIQTILQYIGEWMRDKKIPSSNQIIFRGLTGIYDCHYICSGAAIRLRRSSQADKNEVQEPRQRVDSYSESENRGNECMIGVYNPEDINMVKESESSPFSYSDYISYHEHLIQDAKLTEPDIYNNISDLEVLADLQHFGTATCLVDFSRNMLTSLWFACREKSGKIKNPQNEFQGRYGILYCYNTQHDIINENNLTIVSPREVKSSISSLLGRTKKITNFCSDSEYTFMLWEPTHINTRISKQDSVFLFGLSKFDISKHPILSIIIHDDAKAEIIKALDQIFKINANTIFHDKQGYASINGKFDPMTLNHSSSASYEDLYQHGINDMFGNHYEIALEYFYAAERKLIEKHVSSVKLSDVVTFTGGVRFQLPDTENPQSVLEFAELFLSKAICYKHLVGNDDTAVLNYNTNALQEYLKAQKLFKMASDKFSQEDKKKMYFRKYLRTTNDVIQMYYKTKDFAGCINACGSVIDTIDGSTQDDAQKEYSSIFCKIARLELVLLQILTGNESVRGRGMRQFARFYKAVSDIDLTADNHNFNRLLILFFKKFHSLYMSGLQNESKGVSRKEKKEVGNGFEKELKTLYGMAPFKYIIDYSAWDFTEIKEIIEGRDFVNGKKQELQRLLATMIGARDYYRILCLNNNNSD